MSSLRVRVLVAALMTALFCVCGFLYFRGYYRSLVSGALYDAARFHFSELRGVEVDNPTVLQFGPDGALYVAGRNGEIQRLEIERRDSGWRVYSSETITSILDILNHDDSGRPQPDLRRRLITGMAVTGSAQSPVLYISSSDPRIERPEIDSNSGVLSRLVRAGAGWQRTDLVRGFPRSKNDHAPNGIALAEDNRTLYLSVGSATNMGAPSKPFLLLPETQLSAAILAIDLQRLGDGVFDLPTLDDPARPGVVDENDPFGGNGGLNAPLLPPDGPVRVHAEGVRNAYSLLMTSAGLVTVDNGANAGFGGTPRRTAERGVPEAVEGGEQLPNPVFLIPGPGLYFGHPNPSRPAPDRPAEVPLRTLRTSTNGLALLPQSEATGEIAIATVSLDRKLGVLVLDTATRRIRYRRTLLANFGGMPLDVCAGVSNSTTSGSLWIADMGQSAIYVLEPARHISWRESPLARQPLRTLLVRYGLWWMAVREDLVDALRAVPRRIKGSDQAMAIRDLFLANH